jgi:hypothetical protein
MYVHKSKYMDFCLKFLIEETSLLYALVKVKNSITIINTPNYDIFYSLF